MGGVRTRELSFWEESGRTYHMIFETYLARRQTTALEDSGGGVRPWRGEPADFRIRQDRRREGWRASFIDTTHLWVDFFLTNKEARHFF